MAVRAYIRLASPSDIPNVQFAFPLFTGSDFDIDHKVRWTDSFDNTELNLQALCVSCHRLKTSDENSK